MLLEQLAILQMHFKIMCVKVRMEGGKKYSYNATCPIPLWTPEGIQKLEGLSHAC